MTLPEQGEAMTNYNERLDEILDNHAQEFKAGHLGKVKQAITSLIKELVEEAKPKNNWLEGSDLFYGHDEGVGEFEQNLLKALNKEN